MITLSLTVSVRSAVKVFVGGCFTHVSNSSFVSCNFCQLSGVTFVWGCFSQVSSNSSVRGSISKVSSNGTVRCSISKVNTDHCMYQEVVLVMSAGNSFVPCSSTQVSSNSSKISGDSTNQVSSKSYLYIFVRGSFSQVSNDSFVRGSISNV